MKSKRVASLILVMLILLGNIMPVFAGNDTTINTLIPMFNLDEKTIDVVVETHKDDKFNNHIEPQLFNTLDFRVTKDLKLQTWNPNKSDGSGIEIPFRQALPYYYIQALNRTVIEKGKIEDDDGVFYKSNDRSFGNNKDDLKVSGFLSKSSMDSDDTLNLSQSYPSRLLTGDLKGLNTISQDESKYSLKVANDLSKGLADLFREILPRDATEEDFRKAVEDFIMLPDSGGVITVAGTKYTVVKPSANGKLYNEAEAKKAKRNKENYIYDRDEDNVYYYHVFEGTMPIDQVEYGKLTTSIFAVSKGYQNINGKIELDVTYRRYYAEDRAYFTIVDQASLASGLYYGKGIHTGNTTYITKLKGILAELDQTGTTSTLGIAGVVFNQFEEMSSFGFFDEDELHQTTADIQLFHIILLPLMFLVLGLMLAPRVMLASSNPNMRQGIWGQFINMIAFSILNSILVALFYLVLSFGTNLIQFMYGYWGNYVSLANSATNTGEALVILGIAIAMWIISVVMAFCPLITLVLLTFYPLKSFKDLVQFGRIEIQPLVQTFSFTAFSGIIYGGILVSFKFSSIYKLNGIAVLFGSILTTFVTLRILADWFGIDFKALMGAGAKAGASMAMGGFIASKGASAVSNTVGTMGTSKGQSGQGASSHGDSSESASSGGITGTAGGESNMLDNQWKENASRLQGGLAKSGMGKAMTMAGDTAKKAGSDIKSAYESRGGGVAGKSVRASFGTVGSGIGKLGQGFARQTSNLADASASGFKAIADTINGNPEGALNNLSNMNRSLGAIKNAAVDTLGGAKGYVRSAYADGQAGRLLEGTKGVKYERFGADGFKTDGIKQEMFEANGLVDAKQEDTGVGLTYSWKNASPEVQENLKNISMAHATGNEAKLREMGISNVQTQKVYDKDNKVVDTLYGFTAGKEAFNRMGLETLRVKPDRIIEAGYDTKKSGGTPMQYIPKVDNVLESSNTNQQKVAN